MNNLDETNTLDTRVYKKSLEWYKKFSIMDRSSLRDRLDILDNKTFRDDLIFKPAEIEWEKRLERNKETFACICKKKDSITIEESVKPKKPRKQKEKLEGPTFCSVNWKYVFNKRCYVEVRVSSQTFYIKCEDKLSLTEKMLFKSFKNKHLYHAIDDILYSLKSNIKKRDNLLALLYSPVISLQNNLFIDFFEIWINEIKPEELSKKNKFVTDNSQNLNPDIYIKIKLDFRRKRLSKKQESLW